MERKIEMKIRYFIKKKIETSTHHHHGILKQKFRKTSKHESRKNEQEKEQKSTPQISADTRRLNSKNCLILRQLNVHRSQPILEPLNFTVQIASRISDNSFQVSNFNFQSGTIIFKSYEVEQRLLVLFKVRSSRKPPVINRQQSTTCI